MEQTRLDDLWSQAKGGDAPAELKVLSDGVRGFWKDISPNEIVNIIGSFDEVILFYNTYLSDIISMDSWYQGPALDAIEEELPLTDPQRILSFMPNHLNGDPPTIENPNWVHVFAGQPPDLKVFAGAFSTGLSKGFL